MLRVFNAFQITTLFASMPYLIAWLYGNPFPFSLAAFYTAIVAYIVLYIWHIAALADTFGDWKF